MKKFLSYVLTFIVMFLMSAGVTVWFSYSRGNNGVVDPNQNVDSAGGTSFFTQLLETFNTEKQFKIKGDLVVSYNDYDLPLNVDVNIDISETSNIKLEGVVIADIQNSEYAFDFVYFGNQIYLAYNQVFVKVKIDDIGSIVDFVKNLVSGDKNSSGSSSEENGSNTGLESITGSIDFEKILDDLMPTLMESLNNIKEEELEGGDKKYTLSVSGLATAGIVCNSEDVLKRVDLKTEKLAGVKVEAGLEIDFDKTIVVTNPSEDSYFDKYLDLTNVVNIVKNTMSKTDINLFANISVSQNSVGANLAYDFSSGNFNLDLTNNSYGYIDNAKLVYVCGDLYVNINNMYILVSEEMIKECSPMIKDLINNLDVEQSLGVTEEIKGVATKLENTLKNNFASILAFVQNIKLTNEGVSLIVDSSVFGLNFGEIEIAVYFDQSKLTGAEVKGLVIEENEINLQLSLSDQKPNFEVEDVEKYLDIYEVYNSNLELLGSKEFDISVLANIVNGKDVYKINLDVLAGLDGYLNLDAKLTGAYDLDVYLTVENRKLYLAVGEAKVQVEQEKIQTLLNNLGIQEKIGAFVDEKTLDISSQLKNLTFNQVLAIVGIAKDINITKDGVILDLDGGLLGLNGQIRLYVGLNQGQLKFIQINGLEIENKEIDFKVMLNKTSISKPVVDETDYLDITATFDRINKTLETTNGTITLKANVGYGEEVYNIDLSLCGSIEEKFAKIVLALSGTYDAELNASLYNDNVYINTGDVYVKTEVEKLVGLVGMLMQAEFSFDINSNDVLIVQNLLKFINNFTLEDLEKIEIVSDGDSLAITLDKSILGTEADFVLSISFVDENVTNISFTKVNITEDLYASVNLTLDTTPVTQQQVKVEEEKYLDVENTVNRIKDILSTTNGTITLKANVGYGEEVYNIDLSLCGSVEEKFAKIVLTLSGTYELDLNANYYNEKLYANMGEAFVSVDLEYILAVLGLAKDKVDVEELTSSIKKTEINYKEIFIVKNLLSFIENISYEDLSKVNIVANSNGLSVTLDKSILGTEADFVLAINFVSDNVTTINFTKVNVTEELSVALSLTLDTTPVEQTSVEVEASKYLDVEKTVNRIKDILSTTNGTITLKANVGYGEEVYNIDLSLCGSVEEKFAKIVLALSGTYELDINANYYNEKLYANMGEAFVSVDLEYILAVLGLAQEKVDVEGLTSQLDSSNFDPTSLLIVQNLMNFFNNICYEDLSRVNIVANNNGLSLTLDKSILGTEADFVLAINFVSDAVTTVNFTKVNVTEELSVALSLTLDTTPVEQTAVEVDESKYLDVEKTVNRIKDILSTTNGTITLKANVGYGEEVYNIDLSLCGSVEEKFAKIVLALSGTYELDLNASMYNDDIYFNISEIFVSIGLDTIEDVIEEFTKNENDQNQSGSQSSETSNETYKDLLIVKNILKFINNFSVEDLEKINLIANNNGLSVTLDKTILGTEADFVLSINFVSDNVTTINFTKVNVTEELSVALSLTLDTTPVTQQQVKVEEEKYLDVENTVNRIKDILSTTNGTITLKANVGYGEEVYNIDLSLCGSVEEKFAKIVLALGGTYELDVNANYYNEKLYANMGEAFVSVDLEYILAVLGLAKDKVDVEELTSSIKKTEINYKEIFIVKNLLSFIENISYEDLSKVNIVANSNGLSVTLDKTILGTEADFVLSISFVDENVTNISFTKVNITEDLYASVNLMIDTTPVQQEVVEVKESKYIDVETTVNRIKDILSTTNGTITLKANVGYGEEVYNIDLSLCGSVEEKFAKIVLALGGTYELDVNANYYDEKLYANMGEAFVSVDLEYILAVLGFAQEKVDIEELTSSIKNTEINCKEIFIVKNLLRFIENISYEDLSKIKIVANNNGLSLTLDKSILGTEADFVLAINFVSDNVTTINFTKVNVTEELSVALSLTLDTTPVTQQQVKVEEEKYLDVENTVNRVKDILSTTNGTITLKANVGYGEEVYNIDLSLCGSVEEKFAKIVLALSGTYELDINANYYNEKLYANMGEAFVSVDLEYILAVLGLAKDKVDVEELTSSLENVEFDANSLLVVQNLMNFFNNICYEDLSKVNIVANNYGLTLTLDKSILGTETDFVLAINFVSDAVTTVNFTKVNITEDLYASVNLTIDTTPVKQTAVEVEESKYLDVETTINKIKDILSTTNGTITLKANVGYGEEVYNIDLSLCGSVEEKFAKIMLTLTGSYELNLNASYYEEKAFIDFEEIMLSVGISDLKELLSNFGFDLDKSISDTSSSIQEKIENEGNKETINESINDLLIVKNLMKFIENISYENLKKVKVVANNNGLSLTLDKSILGTEADFVLAINFVSDNVTTINFTKVNITEDLYANAQLTIDVTKVEQSAVEVNDKNYLDLGSLMDNLEEIIDGENLWIDAELSLFNKVDEEFIKEMGLSLDFGKKLTGVELNLYALIEFMYKEYTLGAQINYNDSTLFASLLGLDVKVANDDIIDTVHTILGLFSDDVNAYDKILGMITDILDGKSIIDEIKQFTNSNESEEDQKQDQSYSTSIDVNYEKLLSELINNVKINANLISVEFNLECLGYEGIVVADITLSGGKITKIVINKLKLDNKYLDATLTLDYSEKEEFPVISEEDQSSYIDLAKTAGLIEATYETLKDQMISGTITMKFDKDGEVDAVINYGFRLVEGEIEAYASTNFKGIDVNVYYKHRTFYLDIVGLKVYIEYKSINDLINWINEEFDTNIDFSTESIDEVFDKIDDIEQTASDFNLENLMKTLSSLDLSFINSVTYNVGTANVVMADDYSLTVVYGEKVDSVGLLIKDKLLFDLEAHSEFDESYLKNIYPITNELNVYSSYTKLIELYDSIMATVDKKQYDITANAKVYQEGKETYNVDIFDFAIDVTDKLNAYGSAMVTGEENVEFDAAYKNDMLYVNYDGLKLSMSWDSIKELLVIVLELVGLDPTTIGFLEDVANEMNVNTDNLGNYLPGMDFDNPLNSIKYIKQISLNNGIFSVTIDGKLMNPDATTNMDIIIGTDGKLITNASITNFFTGTSDERFDLMVNLNEYKGVKELTDSADYHDLSNATDLIKAFINTSDLNDYHIAGRLNLALAGMDGLVTLGVDAKIKSDEEGNVVADIEINNYPLLTWITDNNTNGGFIGRKRVIKIYYRDGEVYLRTIDAKFGLYSQLNRITKVHPTVLFDNIEYYIQWLLGFTDSIQSAIDNAIYESKTYPGETDMGNILIDYNLESDGRHKIIINLGELAHTSDIGNATLYIATTKIDEQEEQTNEDGTTEIVTVQKDYIYSLDLDVDFLDGMIAISTDSDNKLYLTDIGQTVDVSGANNYMDLYPYNQDAEYEKEGDLDSSNMFNGFTQTNANTVYVSFDTDGGDAISQMSGIIGANMSLPTPTKVIGGVTYQFVGWYYEDGEKCELTSFPRNNITLYAKWFKYQLNFDTNGGFDIKTREEYEGTLITLPTPTKYVDKGDVRTYYTFEGWYLNPDFEGNAVTEIVLTENTTVYAKWSEDRVAETRTLYVYSNGRLLVKERYEIGAQITLPEGIVGSTRVVDKKKVDYSVYKCIGWDTEVSVMGNKEIVVTAIWELIEYKKYYKVTIHTDWYDPNNAGVTYDNLDTQPTIYNEEIWLLEGEKVNLNNYVQTAKYETGALWWKKTYNYQVVGWKNGTASYGSTVEIATQDLTINQNYDLYAVWQQV